MVYGYIFKLFINHNIKNKIEILCITTQNAAAID